VRPLRQTALASAALVLAVGLLVRSPLALLLPLLVVAAVVSMSWNGLSFTAAAELAGHRRSGAGMGLQQTMLAATNAATPPLFALLVGGLGWGPAYALSALGPVAGYALLRGLRA
jgi:hypothetical protein